MMVWKRITKREARKLFDNGETFYLLSCKMYPSFWGTPCPIEPIKYWEHSTIIDLNQNWTPEWTPKDATPELKAKAWESMYNNWAYYNTDWERGYYAHYYVKKG